MIPRTTATLITIITTTTIPEVGSFLVTIIHRTTGVHRTIRGTEGGTAILSTILSGAVHTIQPSMLGWRIHGMVNTPIMEATTAMGTILMARPTV